MHYVIAFLTAGILQAESPNRSLADPCAVLTTAEIQRIQSATVTETKASSQNRNGLHFLQCVYATSDFTHSVSVTLISGAKRSGVRSYWKETFEKNEAREGKKPSREPEEEAARKISGVGDEAFWTGDSRAGALYVLRGGQMLRISVGGVADEKERIRRSQTLATTALRRVN
jgi:hypothetical protein